VTCTSGVRAGGVSWGRARGGGNERTEWPWQYAYAGEAEAGNQPNWELPGHGNARNKANKRGEKAKKRKSGHLGARKLRRANRIRR